MCAKALWQEQVEKKPRLVRAQGVTGMQKGRQRPDPTGPRSHTEEFCFILKSAEIIKRCARKTELGLEQCGRYQNALGNTTPPKFSTSAKLRWARGEKGV